MKNNTITETCHSPYHSRVSWSAVFSGAFVGLGLGFLLHLFGMAISLSAYNAPSAGAATTIAVGGLLGLLIGTIASMGAAGFVAGYLGRFFHHSHCGGVLYGFLTWTMALLLAAIFAIPLAQHTSAYSKTLAPKVVVSDSMPQKIDVTTEKNTSPSTTVSDKTDQPVVVKVSSDTLTGSSWIIFTLFFIGALSSCIGACLGMKCKRNEVTFESNPPV
ncbi:hypothetical protein [Legionella fairfieldensis]|uniref:hypothetical protein n=1 Tax=Legionella fairfieldensis TaxID=45064 RepID=UPI000683E10B|nr:hypothetical protein [Legionella fairfieldensis]